MKTASGVREITEARVSGRGGFVPFGELERVAHVDPIRLSLIQLHASHPIRGIDDMGCSFPVFRTGSSVTVQQCIHPIHRSDLLWRKQHAASLSVQPEHPNLRDTERAVGSG